MKPNEFNDLMKKVIGQFGGYGDWVRKQPSLSFGDGATVDPVKAIRDRWLELFRAIELVDALAALESITGDVPFGKLPEQIASVARQRARSRADAKSREYASRTQQRHVRCWGCRDEGVRCVIHPESLSSVRMNRSLYDDPDCPMVYRTIVACTCSAGETWSKSPKMHLARYDRSRHCLWPQDSLTIDGTTYNYETLAVGDALRRMIVESVDSFVQVSTDWSASQDFEDNPYQQKDLV